MHNYVSCSKIFINLTNSFHTQLLSFKLILRQEMMASRKTLLILSILIAVLILAMLHETEARGSRSRRTSSRVTNRKPKTKRVPSSNAPKPKPKSKTFHSKVTYSQTQVKKRPFDKRFLVAAAAGSVTYALLTSPVYSRRYRPYYGSSNIAIPKHRALKIEKESYSVLTKSGSRCQDGNLTKYDENNVVNVTTKVSYEKAKHVAGATKFKPIRPIEVTDTKQTNLTLSAEAINDYVAKIEIWIAFNESILTNATSNTTMDLANCTILKYESQAYVTESFAFRNKTSFVLFLFALFVSIMT